jgi:hypothetical protein
MEMTHYLISNGFKSLGFSHFNTTTLPHCVTLINKCPLGQNMGITAPKTRPMSHRDETDKNHKESCLNFKKGGHFIFSRLMNFLGF